MKAQVTETGFDIMVFLTMFLFTMEGALWAVGILIMSDTITGIWGSIKEGGWAAFETEGFAQKTYYSADLKDELLTICNGLF